jgi:hypothetical protein
MPAPYFELFATRNGNWRETNSASGSLAMVDFNPTMTWSRSACFAKLEFLNTSTVVELDSAGAHFRESECR